MLLSQKEHDKKRNLTDLCDIGIKINSEIKEIKFHVDKMMIIRSSDQEVNIIYKEFLKEILNDKDKSKTFNNLINLIDDRDKSSDIDLLNMDLNKLTDCCQYIIASAEEESLGTIMNSSYGICTILGYKKTEMLGQNLSVLIPEIYQKNHYALLIKKIEEYKLSISDSNWLKNKYKTNNTEEKRIFAKTKSRYIIPLYHKIWLLPSNDQNQNCFISKFMQQHENYHTFSCYLLTDMNLIIQHYTANLLSMLEVEKDIIVNGETDLAFLISKYTGEYEIQNDKNNYTELSEEVIAKYASPVLCNWKVFNIDSK